MASPRERLTGAHLYLVCDELPDEFLRAALLGGVEIVQLRMKRASDERIVAAARRAAAVCREHGALVILDDRPDLAVLAGLDGVHVGQDDVPAARARELIGPDRLVGLSTHSPFQIDAAAEAGVDYIGVGPVHETPTKPGRPAVGVELVRYAADNASMPFFAIGGITAELLPEVMAAGADRIAVVRAITEATDPRAAAASLRAALRAVEDPVGAA